MRISDWSSDVCSSDLAVAHHQADAVVRPQVQRRGRIQPEPGAACVLDQRGRFGITASGQPGHEMHAGLRILDLQAPVAACAQPVDQHAAALLQRSEEHTSELQSLMRISYAVFCLKKKNITTYKSPT